MLAPNCWCTIGAAGVLLAIRVRAALRAAGGRLVVVWDLDDCLIKSEHLRTETDAALSTTLCGPRCGGGMLAGDAEIEHVDDDLMVFRTVLRPHARLVLRLLRPFCAHVVFTSASRGYMLNILRGLLDDRAGLFERGAAHADAAPADATARLRWRGPLSSSDFARGHLRRAGKDVRETVVLAAGGGEAAAQEAAEAAAEEDVRKMLGARAVLVDDQPGYHIAQPHNGILVPTFAAEAQSAGSLPAMWQLGALLLRCALARDCRPVLSRSRAVASCASPGDDADATLNGAYWRRLCCAQALPLGRSAARDAARGATAAQLRELRTAAAAPAHAWAATQVDLRKWGAAHGLDSGSSCHSAAASSCDAAAFLREVCSPESRTAFQQGWARELRRTV
jgi:hypothetical protein